jgi:hypothetical protein
MSKNPYSYSRATFYSSSSSLDEDGHRTTTSWRGGYGKESKDGETRFFVLPSDGQDFVQANEDEYKKTKEIANSKFAAPLERVSLPAISEGSPPSEGERPRRRIRGNPWAISRLERRLPDLFRDDFFFGNQEEIDRLRKENEELRRQLGK